MIELFSTVHFTPLDPSLQALLVMLIGGIVYYAIFLLFKTWITFSVSLKSPWHEIVFFVPLTFGSWLAVYLALISK